MVALGVEFGGVSHTLTMRSGSGNGIPILYALTQGFAQVFRDKQSDSLQTWLDQATRTGLPEIGHFCEGLRRDEKAVNAAVILPWSNG